MHHFIPEESNDAVRGKAFDPAQREAIRGWVRKCLSLDEEAVIQVNEIACADPGCPLVETVIAVFEDGRTRSWTFTRPRVAVTRMMVEQALRPA